MFLLDVIPALASDQNTIESADKVDDIARGVRRKRWNKSAIRKAGSIMQKTAKWYRFQRAKYILMADTVPVSKSQVGDRIVIQYMKRGGKRRAENNYCRMYRKDSMRIYSIAGNVEQ